MSILVVLMNVLVVLDVDNLKKLKLCICESRIALHGCMFLSYVCL